MLRFAAIGLLALNPLAGPARAEPLEYPPTRTVDVVDVLHGVEIPDPYRWLEDSEDPEVIAWTQAQNALTRAQLDRFAVTRAALKARLEKLYYVTSTTPPAMYGDRDSGPKYFFTRRSADQNHAVVYVRPHGLDKEATVVIDPNKFSKDGTSALDWWVPSPNGKLVVYGKSEGGSELSTLHLRDVASATDLALEIPRTRACSVSWDPDSHGFHYTRYPQVGSVPAGDEQFYRHVYYHRFGTNWEDDPKVFGEDLAKEIWNDIGSTTDNRYQYISSSRDWTANDFYIRRMGDERFETVATGLDGRFSGDTLDDKLYIHTDYQAPRYRVLVTDADNPGPDNWRELIPEQKHVIRAMLVVGRKLVLHVLDNAHSRLLIYDPDGTLESEVELPTLGTVSRLSGRSTHADLFFQFDSFAHPTTNYRYNVRKGELEIIDQLDVGVALDEYVTTQVWFNSKDGTRVPMFVVHKKGLVRDGSNPTLLYGYGGFNHIETPFFYRAAFEWFDRGGVFAVANIRGGGEFGKEWHVAGRLGNKQNTFDDFAAAAEKLIADNYTNPERLAMRGGSNGGLLVGAVMVQRPELFKAVVCLVPLLDMLRYHEKKIGRLWIPEYGDPDLPEDFQWLRAWSPYHNVKPGTAYPAVYFRTADGDSRVDPMHARKMAALLQSATSSSNPVLLWIESKAGHGAGEPMSKYIDRQLDTWTFLMWQLGMIEE